VKELVKFLMGLIRVQFAVLVQFSGKLLISVAGSKIENKFLITFSLFCYYEEFFFSFFFVFLVIE